MDTSFQAGTPQNFGGIEVTPMRRVFMYEGRELPDPTPC